MDKERTQRIVRGIYSKIGRGKTVGWVSAIGGAISSVAGIIGVTCVMGSSVCGGICIVGPVVAIMGVSIAEFLHQYNILFIVIGGLLFLLGIFLIIRKREISCVCSNLNSEIKHATLHRR